MMQVLAFGLGVSFGDRRALESVDLSLEGGVTVVLGPNGAGKSTLLRCLATVLAPDQGTLLLDGMDPTFEADRIEIRRRLGLSPAAPRTLWFQSGVRHHGSSRRDEGGG